MESILNHYLTGNGKTGNNAKWLCPFHDDCTPSMQLNPKTGKAHCFPCSKDFDALDIIQKVTGSTFKDAQNILSNFTGKPPKPLKNSKESAKRTPDRYELPAERKNANTAVYIALLKMLTLSKTGADYLASRGISRATADRWQVKSIDNPGKTFADLKSKFTIEQLTDAGLTSTGDDGNIYFIFYLPCVLFPALENNQPVYLTSRNLTTDNKKKSFLLKGIPKPLFIGNRSCKEFLVFEGIPDALSYFEIAGKYNFIVCFGIPTPDRLQPLYIDGKRLISALDNDQRKPDKPDEKTAVEKAIERIRSAGYDFPLFDYDGYLKAVLKSHLCPDLDLLAKDLNDILKIKKALASDRSVLNALYLTLSATQKEDYEERTAIMMHDSNLTETTAKIQALLRVCYGKGKI